MHFPKAEGGFILLFTLVLMVTLLAIVAGYLYLVSIQTRVAGSQLNDTEAFNLAEAGLERGIREIRDDVLSTTQVGIADLRGNDTQISGTVSNRNNVRYFDETTAIMTPLRITPTVVGSTLDLWNYDRNYLGTRIRKIQIGCRYKRSGNSGNNPFLEISYTTNGIFPQAGNSSFATTVSSTGYNDSPFIVLDVTNDAVWDWAGGPQAVWQQINNSNFRVRACAYTLVATNRRVEIDYLFVKVDYEIDTNTETWYQGFSNISLGDGNIESIDIIDESSKVNINYAADYSSNLFLRWLFRECGISSTRARNIATAVINYRNGLDTRPGRRNIDDDADGITDETDELGWSGSDDKPFSSIEEIKNIPILPLLTEPEFAQIRDFITVYSYVNAYATRPPAWNSSYPNRDAGRAPVNINSASTVVLQAMFDQILGETTAGTLATQIIDQRTTVAPFSCFYNSDSLVTTDFYDFIMGSSLTPLQKDQILDNADSSWLPPRPGMTVSDCRSTEFSYDTNSFMIDAVGRKRDSTARLRMIIKDDGNKYLDTYIGDTELTRYWRQVQ